MSAMKRETICWYCEKATGRCSWSQSFEPVKGWEAIPKIRRVKNYYSGKYEYEDEPSYTIISCPEFVRG